MSSRQQCNEQLLNDLGLTDYDFPQFADDGFPHLCNSFNGFQFLQFNLVHAEFPRLVFGLVLSILRLKSRGRKSQIHLGFKTVISRCSVDGLFAPYGAPTKRALLKKL